MKKRGEKLLCGGSLMLALFVVWTWLVQSVDVRPAGVLGTDIGFAEINVLFHELTGVHMWFYIATDWLGLVPVFVCLLFGSVGAVQLVKRKSLHKVDLDIILLGLYYLLVVVSTPMICGRYWVYSLLLWAILLWCCIAALRRKKRN